MDDAERHASGAHYTAHDDIMRVVGPTIVEPWRKRILAATTLKELTELRAGCSATASSTRVRQRELPSRSASCTASTLNCCLGCASSHPRTASCRGTVASRRPTSMASTSTRSR